MRKNITYLVFIMLFSMFSSPVFAGQYEECDVFKGSKRLYGLCNAYQNAYYAEDEETMADIWANWNKWATEDDPVLPNSPDDVEVPVTCPCWDYAILEQELACNAYAVVYFGIDETEDNSGEDFALFDGPQNIQLFAGNTFFDQVADSNECNIVAPAELMISSFEAVEGLIEDQCRLDVLDLIDAAGDISLCNL